MRPAICLVSVLAPALLGCLGHATQVSADRATGSSFPLSVEVIPGKLKVRVFAHDVQYEKETIPCWTYVTDGLASQKQKEIMFTLRRDKGQKPEDYPRPFFDLFATFFHYAERGSLVDEGGVTLFAETGFLGRNDFRGIGYVEPQSFPGVETGGIPLLAGILLKDDEALIAWNLGLTRITALLGMKYRYYPVPTWSDLGREPVASLKAMGSSVLVQVEKIGVRASYYEEHNHIFLSVFPSSQPQLRKLFDKLPATTPLAILTQPDARANACLVWTPSNKKPAAITPPGSDGSRKSGAFLGFVPEQKAAEIKWFEDGFYVFLTHDEWQKVRDSLSSGSDADIPLAGPGGVRISIEWAKPAGFASPVTSESTVGEKWVTYQPDGGPQQSKGTAVSSTRIVLLTSEADLLARTTAKELADYVNEVKERVDAFFASQKRIQRELTIHFALSSTEHHTQIAVQPELSPAAAEELRKQLDSVPAPKVAGPVVFDYLLDVWNAKPQ